MRTEVIVKFYAYILLFNAVFLLASFGISWFNNESSALPLLFSGIICIIFGLFPFIFVDKVDNIFFTEGLLIVVGGWLITCLIGMLPYIMWGGEFSLVNAWFESVSGYTTTGSSILNNIEALPKGLLFWRSSTHWIGGIGIILFVLLILPHSSSSRLTLLNAEMNELSKLNFQYKAKRIIEILVIVYAGLTVLETILLMVSGMSLFDAINHSFATIATGGFSTKNLSIAHYNSITIEIIVMLFMVLAGIHFGLLYSTILLKSENIFKSKIVKAFLLVYIAGIVLVSGKLFFSGYYNLADSIRYGSFQVISLGSSTGFANSDSNPWPPFTHFILIYFMIQCSMVGSTSGGIKFDRVYLFFKSLRKQLTMMQHPKAVVILKINNKPISEHLETLTLLFISLYILTLFVNALILTLIDVDAYTAFSASVTTIGGVGPGFGKVGCMSNFASIPDFGKFVLSLNMLMGRLEIFNIIALVLIRKDHF